VQLGFSTKPTTARPRTDSRIFSALVAIVGWIALAKIAGAMKEVAVAARFGISPVVDAYTFVFNFVTWPVALGLSILLVIVLPLLVRSANEDRDELILFRRETLGAMIVLSAAISVLIGGTLFVAVHWNLAHLSSAVLAQVATIYPAMLIFVFLGLINALLAVRLMAQFKHLNSFLEGVPAAVIFIVVILAPAASIWQLVWGTAVGVALQCALLVLALGRSVYREAPKFGLTAKSWSSVRGALPLLGASQLVISFSDVIDQLMVAHIGIGANAKLGYSSRILALLLGLGATSISRALLPVLSDLRHQGDAEMRAVAMQWMKYLFLVGFVLAIVAWLLTPLAISLLYERGAFGARDTSAVSTVVRAGLFQLPFYLGGIVLVQLIAIRRDYIVFFWVNLANLVVKVVGNYFLIGRFGVAGAMYSTTLVLIVSSMLLLAFSLRERSLAAND